MAATIINVWRSERRRRKSAYEERGKTGHVFLGERKLRMTAILTAAPLHRLVLLILVLPTPGEWAFMVCFLSFASAFCEFLVAAFRRVNFNSRDAFRVTI